LRWPLDKCRGTDEKDLVGKEIKAWEPKKIKIQASKCDKIAEKVPKLEMKKRPPT
jgi:hypothetical protein